MGRRSLWKIVEADRDLDREEPDDIEGFRREADEPRSREEVPADVKERLDVEPEPWQAWTLDRTKRKLTVHCLTFKGYEVDRAEHTEDEQAVTVLLYMRKPVSSVKLHAGEHTATVELSAPLGERRVFDGATGRERERR